MKQTAVLIGTCVVVLVSAWLASRALSADVAVEPPPPSQPAPPPVNAPTPTVVRDVPPLAAPTPSAVPAPTQPSMPAPAEVLPQQAHKVDSRRMNELAQGVLPGPRPAVEPDPADEALSPFSATESPELDYAEKLLAEVDGGVERLRSARDVFARCVEAVPSLQRCQEGLAAAQLRLGPAENGTVRPDLAPIKRGNLPTNFPTSQPKSKLR